MLRALIQALAGCSHQRTTFPITLQPGSTEAHVTCLECGQEFAYDWVEMRRGKAAEPRRVAQGAFVTTRV